VILFHGGDLGVVYLFLFYLSEAPVADVQDLPVLLFNGEDPSCVRYPPTPTVYVLLKKGEDPVAGVLGQSAILFNDEDPVAGVLGLAVQW